MPAVRYLRKTRGAGRGAALVIVLFFIVLLSVVTIAFLARSMTAVRVSASSAGETKASMLANSATDIIIGDFKQEIIAGSSGNSGTANYPVYYPSTNLTAIPFQNGVPVLSGTNAVPNMISRSVSQSYVSGTGNYVAYPSYYTAASTPPPRAATDATAVTPTYATSSPYTTSKVSTAYPGLNGRLISPAQWNTHYLIPRLTQTTNAAVTDSTPNANFIPPDWVIVTRNGATSVAWSSGTGGLNDPALNNNNYAVGRYAYAVYNEGGLLDMNVAGYPADTSTNNATTPPFSTLGTNGLSVVQIGRKSGLPLADLTQLSVAGTPLSQAQINNFVGWRNYASAQLTAANGSYGSFTYTGATASNWLTNFAYSNTNGYMQVSPPPVGATTPPTDQALLSRQQLISVTQSLGISADYLQYMGSFSRTLDQPSAVPNPSRPKILTGAVPGFALVDTYTGNNQQQGLDSDPTGINPSFLAITVPTSFTRWNGTTAIKGEPYVKTRFALSWLAKVAYNATTATVKTAYQTAADPDPMLDRFGLTRASATAPWTYNHSAVNGSQIIIGTLAWAASQNREPDFAELLKASILAGSLGKGAPNQSGTAYNYQYILDTNIDMQVLQIMANLIDQQDADSYPTVIQLYNASLGMYMPVYGVEDVPYFYRYHLFSVVDRLPNPVISKNASVVFPPVVSPTTCQGSTTNATTFSSGANGQTKNWTIANTNNATCNGCQLGTLTDQGEATFLYVVDLWNPHDPNNTMASSTNRPSQYRVYAVTEDPAPITNPWFIGAESQMTGSNNSTNAPGSTTFKAVFPENDGLASPTYYWPISYGANKSQSYVIPVSPASPPANTTLVFSDNGGKLFREPTMVWNTNATGLALVPGSSAHVTDANTGNVYYGVIAGKTPISQQVTIASTPAQPTDGKYIFQGSSVSLTTSTPTNPSYPQITFFLQYLDSGGNWITYDSKYPDLHGMSNPNLTVNTADYSNNSWQNPLANGQFSGTATCMDPRSARWSVGTAETLGNRPGASAVAYTLEPSAAANVLPNTTAANQAMGTNYFAVLESNRPRGDPCNYVYYSNPCMTSDPPQNPPYTTGLRNLQMRWFAQGEFRAGSTAAPNGPKDFNGLFSQNNFAITNTLISQSGTAADQIYYEDPDGMARRAMGAYAGTTLTDVSIVSTASVANNINRVGLPLATASTFDNFATPTPQQQSQSRPIVLNRPFRSVGEMSYAFRGTPWKNIDFFTPESGDAELLDTFCLNDPPPSALVAGKVDLNTRQTPVLQAIIAGAYRDEVNNMTNTPPVYAYAPLNSGEASSIAGILKSITTDTTHPWRGPLQNVSELVGKYVVKPTGTSDTDFVTYGPPALYTGTTLPSVSYAGFSAALNSTFNGSATNAFASALNTKAAVSVTPIIQRMRESALRPLAAAGQTRVWNLLIDVVAQTGRYPKSATGLDQFLVEGQKRLWVHVAIDRYTGQVLDKQVEVVTP